MKRLLSILLLTLYLNSYTEVHEIFRVPILLEHFAEHRLLVDDLSFWEFLTMHYENDTSHDSTDNQLPFKVPGHSFTGISLLLLPLKISLADAPLVVAQRYNFDYKESYFSSSLQDIFQPPRLA